ncbi:alpha-ketoglutarate-dependent dioxygenase AlkB [Sorangium sp. So ce429]
MQSSFPGGASLRPAHAARGAFAGRPNPVIASVSLGTPRRFILKPAGEWKDAPAIELELGGGSLLVMGGTTQHHHRHGVPKQRGVGPRINLTFRRIHGPGLRAGAGT